MIAVNLMWKGTLDLRRTEAALAADQGLMYVQGAEAWAADILRQDLVDSPNSDHFGEQWAIELPPLPVDGGTIAGRLEDLQARFNLNNLIGNDGKENELALRQFERLLVSVEADPALAGAVIDWLDPDTELRFPTGGEDVAYIDGDPPYRTANSMVTSASELMAITGFDRETYRRLAPYVTVLPAGTKLNVNTASDVVLASLSDNIDIGTAGLFGRAARGSRVHRHRCDVRGARRGGRTARHRRRKRPFFIDRDRDARVKSAHDALSVTARSKRNHASSVPQPRSRVAWLRRSSFVCPTRGLQPGVRSTRRGVSSGRLAAGLYSQHILRLPVGAAPCS